MPVKSFDVAKQRLADLLSSEERSQLAHEMLADVLRALLAAAEVEGILIVTGDVGAVRRLRLAQDHRVEILSETPAENSEDPLNAALRQATRILVDRGLRQVAIFHADLPLLDPADVATICAPRHDTTPSAIVASDRHRLGTNCLVCSPPDAIELHYGPNSCRAHAEAARAAGVDFEVVSLQSIACDIDTIDDLDHVLTCAVESDHAAQSRTLAFLRELGIPSRLEAQSQPPALQETGS